MTQDEAVNKLLSNRLLRSPSECWAFDDALMQLSNTSDVELLSQLFQVFDDKAEHSEVMWGLVHYVEAFDTDVYLRGLAEATPQLLGTARDWLQLLHIRILNSEPDLTRYEALLPTLPELHQATIRQVLEDARRYRDAV